MVQSYGIPEFVQKDLSLCLNGLFNLDTWSAAAGIAFVSRAKNKYIGDNLMENRKWLTTDHAHSSGSDPDFGKIFEEITFPMHQVQSRIRKLMPAPSVQTYGSSHPLLVYCCLSIPRHMNHPNPTEAVSECADRFLEGLIKAHKQYFSEDPINNVPITYKGTPLGGNVTHSIFPFWAKASFDYAGLDQQPNFNSMGLATHLSFSLLKKDESQILELLRQFYTDV
ncbi:hypothetical protein KY329_00015 [Candidatus Woesearchaeota archaeon]|nr:hypothetical protein [Candidatus Woesearchaeota archaeon]